MRILLLHSRYLSGAASGENRVVEEEAALLRSGGNRVWCYSPEPAMARVPSTGRVRRRRRSGRPARPRAVQRLVEEAGDRRRSRP